MKLNLGIPKKNRAIPNERSRVFILNERDINNIRKSLITYHYKVNGDTIKKTLERHIDLYFRDEIKTANLENRAPYVPSLKQFHELFIQMDVCMSNIRIELNRTTRMLGRLF